MSSSISVIPEMLRTLLQNRQAPLRSTLTHWIVVLLGLVAERGLITLALIVLARRSSLTGYGQYISSYSLLSLLIVLPGFGLDTWLLVEGSYAQSKVATLWKSSFRLRVILNFLWFIPVFFISFPLPNETFPSKIFFPTAIALAADSISILTYSALRSCGSNARVFIFQLLSSLSLFFFALVLPLSSDYPTNFSKGRAVIACGLLAVTYFTTRSYFRPINSLISFTQVIRSARPYLLGDIATSLYMRADLTIIAIFLGSAGASIYGPAVNITNMSFLVPNALYFVIVPILSRTINENYQTFRQQGIAQLVLQIFTGVILASGLYYFATPIVTTIFGQSYKFSATILQTLSPVLIVKHLNFAFAAFLVSTGNQGQRAKVQLFSALFNIVANLAVVTRFGVPGVAFIYILSEAILLLGYLRILYNRNGKSII